MSLLASFNLRRFLLTLVLVYAAVAGLQTVADFDLGWQMAAAQHPFSSIDTLSYTVPGANWIYPSLSGWLFRGVFHAGGYAAVSWFCEATLLVTVLIVAWNSEPAVLVLLLAAMPALARQMIPRSGLFTVVLAAAFARLLLDHLRGRRRPLWLLPVLMFFWVNLHPGFIAGLGLMLGYLAAECVEWFRGSAPMGDVRLRVRRAAPWVTAALVATLLNPWGVRMYGAVAEQEHPAPLQASVVRELVPLYRDFSRNSLRLLDPFNAIWCMLAISAVAVVLLAWQRRMGLALFLALAAAVCVFSGRSQGVFLSVTCLLAGDALEPALRATRVKKLAGVPALRGVALCALLLLVAFRCADIVRDRTSVREGQISLFGAGVSWWLPQQAAAFVEEKHLPTELFASFNLSSYAVGRLGPRYRDFADGRYFPFGDRLVGEQLRLAAEPLDNEAWTEAAAKYQIRTVILPLSRFFAINAIPLRDDCASRHWTPVYLDTAAIVFVRNDALPPATLAGLQIDCRRQPLMTDAGGSRMEHYQRLANAAVIEFVLGRNQEAQQAVDEAFTITRDDYSLQLVEGQLQSERNDFVGAEVSLRRSQALHPSDASWYQLGLLWMRQQRYPEAVSAFRDALAQEDRPLFVVEWSLARAEVFNGEYESALRTLDDAARLLPETADRAAGRADIADVQAVAYSQMLNWNAAIAAEEEGVRQTPEVARRWQILAALYETAGRMNQAEWARQKASALGHRGP
jgi:tetratricopeptide (TPR) repeat protein